MRFFKQSTNFPRFVIKKINTNYRSLLSDISIEPFRFKTTVVTCFRARLVRFDLVRKINLQIDFDYDRPQLIKPKLWTDSFDVYPSMTSKNNDRFIARRPIIRVFLGNVHFFVGI